MSFAAVAVAGIGAAATLGGAALASSASNKAADAQAQSARANIALAQQERTDDETLFQPELDRGNAADARLAALYYGDASAGGTGTAAPSNVGQPDWQAYLNNNLDLLAVSRQYADPLAYAMDHYARAGQAEGRALPLIQAPAAPTTTTAPITQQSVLGEINATPQSTYNTADLGVRNASADAAYAGESSLEDAQLARELGLAGTARTEADTRSGTELSGLTGNFGAQRDQAVDLAGTKRADLTGLNTGKYTAQQARINSGLDDRFALADSAYDATRGTADENYGATNDLLTAQDLKRQGFTDQEIADFQAQSAQQEGIALDQLAGRYGVTGQTGKAQRSLGVTTQNVALQNAQYADTKRSADYNTLATGEDAALDTRGGAYTGATATRNASRGTAYDTYYGDSGVNTDNLYNGQEGIDTSYYGDVGAAQTNYWAQLDPATQQYYQQLGYNADNFNSAVSSAYGADAAQKLSALQEQTSAKNTAYNTYSTGRQAALDSFIGQLNADSARGQSGRNSIASAGQSFTGAATSANNTVGAAAGQNAINQGNIALSAGDQIGKGLTSAWAAYDQQRKSTTPATTTTGPYGPQI